MFYKIYCDGGARGNPGPAASAFVVFDEKGKTVFKQSVYLGEETNNVAEYNAVLLAIKWLSSKNFKEALLFLDSQLVVNQLTGIFKIKNEKLQELAKQIKALGPKLKGTVKYKNVPRIENKIADFLVNEELDSETKKTKRSVKSV
ncbi:ribonuclease HI [Candidatus Woesebacteria bacterium]|nr:ribonuclease HI [Candidatus Woesebacteria bacterium]|tara:strand:- start:165 stop:599 length:435 start_codon:yes stop_codon:yes gene_type:complete